MKKENNSTDNDDQIIKSNSSFRQSIIIQTVLKQRLNIKLYNINKTDISYFISYSNNRLIQLIIVNRGGMKANNLS